jgi:hypothetical protein
MDHIVSREKNETHTSLLPSAENKGSRKKSPRPYIFYSSRTATVEMSENRWLGAAEKAEKCPS